MANIESQRVGICQTPYHLVWCPKYLGDILACTSAQTIETLLKTILDQNLRMLTSNKIQPDPFDIFVSLPPFLKIAQAV